MPPPCSAPDFRAPQKFVGGDASYLGRVTCVAAAEHAEGDFVAASLDRRELLRVREAVSSAGGIRAETVVREWRWPDMKEAPPSTPRSLPRRTNCNAEPRRRIELSGCLAVGDHRTGE
jgi:hypothetical protein